MSLIQMHQAPSRLAAWLALIALLLLFIAPVISKSLARSPAEQIREMLPERDVSARASMTDMPDMTAGDARHQPMADMPDMTAGDARHQAMADMPASDCPGMDGDNAAVHNAGEKTHHARGLMDDSACGYCVLLAHLPLDLTSLPPLWSALQAARAPTVALFQPIFPRAAASFFHPRAPPRSLRLLSE
ncbi:DUF2946 domain-containing protein [Erwinia sp. HDF1-3R]|uniref:DUF2946 domain-containing protein n=1 Tax=Erwinia sp. HDF1-3R TaxID=3141543 RepID=UPI0031F4CC90